jgi:hypothetical protein
MGVIDDATIETLHCGRAYQQDDLSPQGRARRAVRARASGLVRGGSQKRAKCQCPLCDQGSDTPAR